MIPDAIYVVGAPSVRACLNGGKREVFEVYCAPVKKTLTHAPKDALVVASLAKARGVSIRPTDDDLIDSLSLKARPAILARVSPRRFDDPRPLLETGSFLACLYGIEDPYNLGDALRSLYAAGCDGVFLPKRDYTTFADTVLRASAGASELIDLCLLEEESAFLELLSSHAITPVCARETRAADLTKTRFPDRFCLFIGGEKRGLPKKLDEAIDFGIRIDYARPFSRSLSAAAAAAALGFAVVNQRKATKV